MILTKRRVRRHARIVLAGLAAAVLAVGLVPAGPAGAQTPPADPAASGTDKVQPGLQATLDATGTADFWIRFGDRADLSQARLIDDWVQRGEAVAAELRATAQASQAGVVELLDAPATGPVSYQAFWATNAIFVQDASAELADRLASRAEVQGLYAPVRYELVEPTPSETQHQINAIEWGIANINADDVWDQFGTRGEGITVANIDTGVQFDHPALVSQYRGNLGGGQFDHNYNWFDAAGNCADAPCDLNGHGTHTMGTMAGDDDAGNQIGVAPAANWIAANGCCPSDAALIASGQWMLEPTDLNGQNPDASRRPHIINNSWGTLVPSNDPFMEDVLEAWAASGIFGMWSNGNNGPGCQTSGSPGSRILNYSAGAYDINNNIAGFSSRGDGQDGEIKPNIAAPGVDVRSSVPGDGYANFDGTSMASPHVAGSIALLWSAAPSVLGDIDATRQLLNGSATDTEDLQCGGTAEDNNVFGEGRLDALALLEAAPTGPTGTLAGTVTDAGTGDPIEGAQVSVTGPADRQTSTGPDGGYSLVLPAGDYTVTASAFGYQDQTAQVIVLSDETTEQNFALQPVASVTVTGQVTDGSGHGWPLYAEIDVLDTPVSTFTDPVTGEYELTLPADTTHTFQVTSQITGYQTLTTQVPVGAADLVRDLQLLVDPDSCDAPGYQFGAGGGLSESFESGGTPAGWTVVDNIGNGQVWRFDDPDGRGNRTGGQGGFAIVDSDFYGSGNSQDTELVSPVMDLSGVSAPVLRFNQDFNWWFLGDDEFTNVDVSIDGGATWETVFHQSGADVPGPRLEQVGLPQAGGEPDVQIRFHYGDATFEFWWQVDEVVVGSCAPLEGGLVLGNVRDQNTGAGVNGATVTRGDDPDVTATTMATPADPATDDGFYYLFSSTGSHDFTASAGGGYVDHTQTVDVLADNTNQADFALAAGQLTVDPTEISVEQRLGESTERTVTITNTGTAPAEVSLSEIEGGFEILGTGAATELRTAPAPSRSGLDGLVGDRRAPAAGTAVVPQTAPAQEGTVTLTHSASQEVVSGNSVGCSPDGGVTTSENAYLRAFTLSDFGIGTAFQVVEVSFGIEVLRDSPTPVTVNLYTLDAEPLIYDNLTLIGTATETLPPQELSIAQVPVAGTVPAGSTLVVEVEPPDLSGVGAFFVGSNPAGQTAPSYLRSEACGFPEPTDTADIGFPDMHIVMNVTGLAGDVDVPWLAVDPTTASLDPGESVDVTVSLDGDVAQPGTYTAAIGVGNDTPYAVDPVGVTMVVNPPLTWGKISGTVTEIGCNEQTSPLAGAIVQINGRDDQVTLLTDEDGSYAFWFSVLNTPLTVIVAKDGHVPQVRSAIIVPRHVQVEDFALQVICEGPAASGAGGIGLVAAGGDRLLQ